MDEEISYPEKELEEFMLKYRREETPENYKKELNTLHVQYFKKDLEYLSEHIAHYQKLHKRWKRIALTVKYCNGILTFVGSVGAIIVVSISTLGALTIPLTAAFAGLGVLSNIGDNGSNLITLKKLKKYRNYLRELEKTNDELFMFHKKALSDNLITDDELKMSKDILEKCKSNIGKLNDGQKREDKTNTLITNDHLEKLRILLEKI